MSSRPCIVRTSPRARAPPGLDAAHAEALGERLASLGVAKGYREKRHLARVGIEVGLVAITRHEDDVERLAVSLVDAGVRLRGRA